MADDGAAPTITGILVIDKPTGRTSMDVCRAVRRRLIAGGAPKRIKVGHGGTLDPLATGVLVVLIGRATRLCDRIMAGEKRYTAEVDLSRTSTTDDEEGEATTIDVPHPPSRADIENSLRGFVGRIMQRPPAYSAMKVGGRRAYKLARAGGQVRLEPRPVEIHEIAVVDYQWPRLVLDIRCGKGTYIRSLARDLGEALGTGGMLGALRRTRVGPHRVEDATSLDDLPDALDPGRLPHPDP